MELAEFLSQVRANKGKGGGWPNCFDYRATSDGHVFVELKGAPTKVACRRLDVWTMAFVAAAKQDAGLCVTDVCLAIEGPIDKSYLPYIEALRRRVSYLQSVNTDLRIGLRVMDVLRTLGRSFNACNS